jgi:hypothetical protein
MNALLVALWWISSYIVVLGHSLRNARPLAKVCIGVVTAIICVGIGITEYGVGFYYAFATKGDQDDLAVRLVPSSVVLLLCGLFFLCSGVLVLSVLCRGAQFKAANKSKALIRIATFIVLTSFFLLFAGSFIYAFMNASYMSETAGNFGIRTTWYAVMLAISTCNIWIFRVRTAEYKKKRQETLSTASGTEDGGKLKVDLFACCRRGVPSIYESKNSSSGVSRAETASTSVSVPSSSSPQTVSSSPQTGEDLLSEFESTAILL